MNREAFKLARDTLRKAVKEYGWRLTWGKHRPEHLPLTARNRYSPGPGKFESEHWSIVHYYDAMMNGSGDEPFSTDERTEGTPFAVEDIEREAFKFDASTQFVVLWHSEQGFETLTEYTADQYDKLREQYDEAGESDNVVTYTAPSAWASYLINGDDSGIEEEDKAQCDAWLESVGLGAPVSCEDAGFCKHHDAFAFMPLAADCQTYSFYREES